MDQHYNPFQNSDLLIPTEHMTEVQALTQTRTSADGRPSTPEDSPFPRYVDMWFLAFCLGVRGGTPLEVSSQWHRFVTGQVLQGDTERIATLEVIAIAHSGDPLIVADPKKVMSIANGFAAAGMPELLQFLRKPNMKPLDGLADEMRSLSELDGIE